MGAYNILIDNQPCKTCGKESRFSIQFKYGELWLYKYRVGDAINWGKMNNGNLGHGKIVVYGFAERCPVCGTKDLEFEVWIMDGRIVSANPLSGNYDFVSNHQDFIVLN